MNRQERRRLKRTKNNNIERPKFIQTEEDKVKWVASLSNEELLMLHQYATEIAEKQIDEVLMTQERCLKAAVLEELDLEIDTVEKVFNRAAALIRTDADNMHKLMEANNYSYEEVLKEVNKSTPAVKSRVMELLDSEYKYEDIKLTIMKEFNFISETLFIVIYKKIIKLYKKAKTLFNSVDKPVKKKKSSKYKILNKEILRDIEAPGGKYHIENGLITTGKLSFNDNDAVSKWAELERNKLRKKIGKLAKDIKVIDEKEEELIEIMDEFM